MATINATTSQGGYLNQTQAIASWSWEDICYASSAASDTYPNSNDIYTQASYNVGRSATWGCGRGYLVFDTSVITGTLTDIKLKIFCTDMFNLVYTPEAVLYNSTSPTLSTSLSSTDFKNRGNQISDPFTSSGWEWLDIGLNGTGLSIAETENEMTIVLRDWYYDAEYYTNFESPPGIGFMGYFHNEAGYIPYLEYTMTVAGYRQIVNGIIPANMSKVDGIAKASISKVVGV